MVTPQQLADALRQQLDEWESLRVSGDAGNWTWAADSSYAQARAMLAEFDAQQPEPRRFNPASAAEMEARGFVWHEPVNGVGGGGWGKPAPQPLCEHMRRMDQHCAPCRRIVTKEQP